MNSALLMKECDLYCGVLLGRELKGQDLYQDLTSLCGEYVLEYEKQ